MINGLRGSISRQIYRSNRSSLDLDSTRGRYKYRRTYASRETLGEAQPSIRGKLTALALKGYSRRVGPIDPPPIPYGHNRICMLYFDTAPVKSPFEWSDE